MDCKILGIVIVIVGCFVTQNKCSDDENATPHYCETDDECDKEGKVSFCGAGATLYCCDTGNTMSFDEVENEVTCVCDAVTREELFQQMQAVMDEIAKHRGNPEDIQVKVQDDDE